MPGRWDAYLSAELRIETPAGIVLVSPMPLMQTTGEYPDREGRVIAVVTAHNPGGQRVDDHANEAAQRRLEAELDRRGLAWWPAAGADPSWTHVEESVAVPGLSLPDAIALGAQFGQEAIFLLSPTALTVADCATGKVAMTGWYVEPEGHHPEDLHPDDRHPDDRHPDDRHPDDRHPDDRHPEELQATEIEVTVFEENFRPDPTEPRAGVADAAAWPEPLGQRTGLLCAVHAASGTVTLHGDGHGGVLISSEPEVQGIPGAPGAPGLPDAPGTPGMPGLPSQPSHRPIAVDSVPYFLATTGVLEQSPTFTSAAWDAGEIAALFVPHIASQDIPIDGNKWSTESSRAYPASVADVPGLVLAESRWDTSDSGGDYLLRIGPWYVIYQTNGDEREIDDLDADDDQAAVAAFKAFLGLPG